MKIDEWRDIGPVQGLVKTQLGNLSAIELAAHVTVNPDNGRMRILVATDMGLLDYAYGPVGADQAGAWLLHGSVIRWASVRGIRLQTDAQVAGEAGEIRELWRLMTEEPKIELAAGSDHPGDRPIAALLDFARACMLNAG